MNTYIEVKNNHRKQTFWQIVTPLVISALIIIAVAVFVVILTTRDASGAFNEKWASISLIYLSLPAIVFLLVLLAILIGLIYIIGKLYRALPRYAAALYAFLRDINRLTNTASDKITRPVIFINSRLTGISVLNKKSPEELTRSPRSL